MMSTVAIVVTYNRCSMLERCLTALQRQSVACDVLVIDNNSGDGTFEYVSSLTDERIFYFNPGNNLGGAGGFNLGMKLAMERGYERLWLMDDDCIPQVDALAELLTADKLLNGNYGFLVSRALWHDGSCCRMNLPKFARSSKVQSQWQKFGLRPVRQATFVSFFLSRKSVELAGLPQKEFFIWGDDVEYSRRLALRCKLDSFLVEKSVVLHAMQNNHGSDIARDVPERLPRYALAYRNENCLYRREGWKGSVYYACRCIYHLLKIFCLAPSERKERISLILSAYKKGFSFNPPIEYFSGAVSEEKS